MHYSSKTGRFGPADFLLQIIGLKIDYNQLLLAKSELFEGRNSKNGEINMFFDCFQLILMGFLTSSLHKNSQNDVKLLETWWFWQILGNGTHIYSNQKHPDFHLDFHQKSPWTPMSKFNLVCLENHNFLSGGCSSNLIGSVMRSLRLLRIFAKY